MNYVRHFVTVVSACWLAGSSAAEGADPTVKQIFPSSGINGPYLIAVLSDGFTEAEHHDFDNAADWVFNTQLFNDDFYKAHQARFTVKTIFRHATASGEAQYGISESGDITNCYIATTPDANDRVEDAVGDLNPKLTVIIANGVAGNGCTRNQWTYIWAGIRETTGVLEHELGHLIADLKDEYSLNNVAYPNGVLNAPNCSTLTTPSWSSVIAASDPPPDIVEGCNYYSYQIWRPYLNCRMKSRFKPFCFVCAREVSLALKEEPTAPPVAQLNLRVQLAGFFAQATPPPPVERGVRLLVEIHSQSHVVKVLKATEVPGPTISRQRPIGTHVYEIRDGNTVTTGVLVGNPFESRAFSGAGHRPPTLSESATVIIEVPRTTLQALRSRGVDVTFYNLDATSPRRYVTPDWLRELKEQNLAHSIGTLTANDLSKNLRELNPSAR